MSTRTYSLLLLALAGIGLGGCSGGGTTTGSASVRCSDGSSFCVVSCDLGCSQNGCAVTEIAENQRLRFTFSQDVAPASVNLATLSIRTASGQNPDGDYVVSKREVTFVPRIRVANGVSSFGFQRNESYLITVVGSNGSTQGVRSVSGASLNRDFSCTVTVSRGIIDEDQAPPRPELVSPSDRINAPVDPTIVVRFSELIDTSPFGGSSLTTPIRYQLRRSLIDPVTQAPSCDFTGSPIVLDGIPRVSVEHIGDRDVTVVSLRPSTQLPGRSCVEVLVTADVRDLAGTPAEPATYEFFTTAGVIQDVDVVETFSSPARMDVPVSSGLWQDGAFPGLVGGDGRHGSFDPTVGTPTGSSTFVFDTDNQTIPPTLTLNGLPQMVTDGKFYFTDFTLPAGTTLRFSGTHVPQIFVRGKVDIAGRIELNAAAMTTFTSIGATTATVVPGQPGGLPGVGGGRGGKGGDRCLATGPNVAYNGQNGEDVRLPAGHAYGSRAVGTGGRGSQMFPAAGTLQSVLATFQVVYSAMCAPGGSGGGFWLAGGQGSANTSLPAVSAGPAPAAGAMFDLFPVPAGVASIDHFLVGGSGGGGGASHPFYAIVVSGQGQPDSWKAGAGGSGGGGTMAIRGGSDFNLRATSVLEAKGGNGVNYPNRTGAGNACPGGAGSGGSFLLQSGARVVLEGRIDTAGGTGSTIRDVNPSNISLPGLIVAGGNGSTGTYRLEAPTTANVNILGAALIPAIDNNRNIGVLTDRDDVVGCAGLWRSIGRIFPPDWLRYVLEIDSDGNGTVDQVYTDDPSYTLPGTSTAQLFGPANTALVPVRVQFQGGRISSATNLPEPNTTIGPWRDFVNDVGPSINADAATGFRFQLLFNRAGFPQAVVKKLTVTFRS